MDRIKTDNGDNVSHTGSRPSDDISWDDTSDVLIIGSGAAGLSAALFAAKSGYSVTLCDSAPTLGGTTATSAGMVWIPCSRQARAAGIDDSFAKAKIFLSNELGNYYQESLIDAYLKTGPKAIDALEDDTELEFVLSPSPDYHPDQLGGLNDGRVLVVPPFDGRRLGENFALLRPPMARMMVLGGMMVQANDISAFLNPVGSWANFRLVTRRLIRYGLDRLHYSRGTELANGNALVARFIFELRRRGVIIRTRTRLVSLIRDAGRIAGAAFDGPGAPLRLRGLHGVVLATGGFPHSPELRKTYAPNHPHAYSLASAENTGGGLEAAKAVGAAIDCSDPSPAFWTPGSIFTHTSGEEETVLYGWLDRGRPGVIAVNPKGRRFVNESNSYHDIVMAMYAHGGAEDSRFYFICDRDFVQRHGLGLIRPWPWTMGLGWYIRRGYIEVADSVPNLARKIGIDAEALAKTVARHNGYAETGIDSEFGRGGNVFNRTLGDSRAAPNPNLAPIAEPPFVALRIVPMTLGTATGIRTDEDARALDAADRPIAGLYAVGNDAASIMRGFYPAAGITLGPGIVFAYRAIHHIMRQRSTEPGDAESGESCRRDNSILMG